MLYVIQLQQHLFARLYQNEASMRAILIFFVATFYATPLLSGEHEKRTTFGETITLSNSISIEYAISHLDELKNQEILISGTVHKVCENKGCWMVLQDEAANSIRVTFSNYAFFMPRNIIGKSVQVQGMLHEEHMNISEARHFAKDAGQSDNEIQRIQQKTKEYRFVATAVKITS